MVSLNNILRSNLQLYFNIEAVLEVQRTNSRSCACSIHPDIRLVAIWLTVGLYRDDSFLYTYSSSQGDLYFSLLA